MPATFLPVMAVPSSPALIDKTNTGLMVMMMEACTGLVIARPLKNNSWFTVTPVNPHNKAGPGQRAPRAPSGTRTAAKTTAASATRNAMNPEGPTFSGMTPLATK